MKNERTTKVLASALIASMTLTSVSPAVAAYADEINPEEAGAVTEIVDTIDTEEIDFEESFETEANNGEEVSNEDEVVEDSETEEETDEIVSDNEESKDEAIVEEPVSEEELIEEEPVVELLEADMTLQDGTIAFTGNEDAETVKVKLAEALLADYEEGMDLSGIEFEYCCEGEDTTTGLTKNTAWGSINGFESSKKVVFVTTTYKHPALKNNTDGDYQVRLAGTTKEVTVSKETAKAEIHVNEGASVALVYNEDASVDYDAIRQAILDAAVAESTPELTLENTTIEYYATATTGAIGNVGKAWMPLEGGTKDLLNYPAISKGNQQIKITFQGDNEYATTSAEVTVEMTDREAAVIEFVEGAEVALVFHEDVTVDYDAVRQAILDTAVAESTPELTSENTTIEYYATATTGAVGNMGKAWMPLEGGTKDLLNYPAISEGEQKIRVTFNGNQNYQAVSAETTVVITERPELDVELNEAPYETGLIFNEDMSYNYEATAAAIVDTVINTTALQLEVPEFIVEYNASLVDGIDSFRALSDTDGLNLNKFREGTWEIRISWAGTTEYKEGNVVVEVTVTDGRTASVVAVKEGATFTYNKDVTVMKRAILDNVIDWDNATLPARETLTLDDFELKYYASAGVEGDFSFDIPADFAKRYVNIEGESVDVLGQKLGYPQMGAGAQQIQIIYKGNAEYSPSAVAETTLNVNKAKVSVNVKWTNIFAGKDMPADFVTTNPVDNFNVYTIYTGITSDVSLGIYLDLPANITDNKLMGLIDPVVNGIFGKTLTQMLNEGISVGELRQLFAAQELLDLLDKAGVDTGSLAQIIKLLDATAGVVDNVRVSFGTPTRAGLYSAIAVTDNKNYETGVGFGTILVRLNSQGVKLNWNQPISGSMTAAQAAEFDFGATLSENGDVTINQRNVSYLYSGLTSKFRIYSSTTKAPTEPGSYVMTVVTLGGDYIAAPITRSFRITK